MTAIAVLAASIVFCLALLVLDGRRRERSTWRDWQLVLTPPGLHVYRAIERRVRDEMVLADLALAQALRLGRLGSLEEARRLLICGRDAIEFFVPRMRERLARMAILSRMALAVAPVKPLKAAVFRTGPLKNLAWVHKVLHQFLVTPAERFRFRLYVLRFAFNTLGRYMGQACRALAAARQPGKQDWGLVDAGRQDLRTATDESLESLLLLLKSLAAEPRDPTLPPPGR